MGNKVTLDGILKIKKMKEEMDKLVIYKERIFTKIDEEMYMLSKADKDGIGQKNLAIFIIAELIESFDEKEQGEILGVLNKEFTDKKEDGKDDKS